MDATKAPPGPSRPSRVSIGELCVFVAGLAIGFWLFAMERDGSFAGGFGLWIAILGGLSVVGPPLLLIARRRNKRRWGPGELLWFSEGISAWLLWPPVVVTRVRAGHVQNGPNGTAATCFAFGTPLMAVYITSALLMGGWIRRKNRGRRRRWSWRERFGLILGALWAATGLYVLYLVYAEEIR